LTHPPELTEISIAVSGLNHLQPVMT